MAEKPLGAGKPAPAHDPYASAPVDNQEGYAPSVDSGWPVSDLTGKGSGGDPFSDNKGK